MIMRRRKFWVPLFLSTLVATAPWTAAPALAQEAAYRVDPVAVTGEAAPGTGGLNYACIQPLPIDLSDSGIVSFMGSPEFCGAEYYDPYAPVDDAIWVGTPGGASLAARTGDPAPGGTAQSFAELYGSFVNETGDVAFYGSLDTGGTSPDNGAWIRSAGVTNLLAMSGDPAPGTAGLAFQFTGPTSFNNLGVATLWAEAGDGVNSQMGIWRGAPGSLDALVLDGQVAPGTGGQFFAGIIPQVSSRFETIAFPALTTDPNPDRAIGIWTAGPAGVNLVALTGDVAPGAGGRVFRDFEGYQTPPPPTGGNELVSYLYPNIEINQTGNVAFVGYIDPIDPADIYRDAGLWTQDETGLGIVALTGDAAPGTPGEPFLYFNHVNINASGQIAFEASLEIADPDRDRGIWTGQPGSLTLIVREGDPAPGTAGETFGSLVMGPSLNDSGEIAFFARLRESGTDGLWIAAADGTLSLIAREGESIQVNAGDYRTIQSIEPREGGLSASYGNRTFNNTGQLAFTASFTDGATALLLSSPVSTLPNELPVANAGPDLAVAENNPILLDGSASYDPDGTILSFTWSIDGVEVSTGPKVTVGPLAVGTHTVSLTVTDRNGASAADDMILTVFSNSPPVANAGPDQTVDFGQLVTLDGTGSSDPEGGALTYVWRIGPANLASGPTPTTGPFVVGTFTVTLTVTDVYGASATDEMVLTVQNVPPIANAGPDLTANYGPTVALDGTGSYDPEGSSLTYAWSLDGVQIGTGPTPNVGPFEVGVHTITLTVTDDQGLSDTDTMVLTAENAPPVSDPWVPGLIATLETAELNGTRSSDPEGDALDYVWTIDGVQIGTGPKPIVGPFDAGTYLVTLTVTDVYGLSDSNSVEMTVLNRAPFADSGPNQTVNFAETATLDGTASYDPEGGPLSYVWTLNGAQIAIGPNPTVGPFAVGNHVIALTVTDDHGASSTAFPMVLTVINEAPVADAGLDQTVNYARTVTLDGAGSSDPEGGALNYSWAEGGVEITTGASPTVGPFAIGIHSVTLTVTDDHGATATDSMVINVVNEAPLANAGPDQTIVIAKGGSASVTLDGSASADPEGAPMTYAWTLDGATIATGPTPVVNLSKATHTIQLTVTDEHGLTSTDTVVVTVTR